MHDGTRTAPILRQLSHFNWNSLPTLRVEREVNAVRVPRSLLIVVFLISTSSRRRPRLESFLLSENLRRRKPESSAVIFRRGTIPPLEKRSYTEGERRRVPVFVPARSRFNLPASDKEFRNLSRLKIPAFDMNRATSDAPFLRPFAFFPATCSAISPSSYSRDALRSLLLWIFRLSEGKIVGPGRV